MAVCVLTTKNGTPNWCEKHGPHEGHYRDYALDPGPKGEKFRKYWDNLHPPHQDKPLPPLAQRAANYLASRAEHIANGHKTVPLEIRDYRWKICEPCEHRNHKHNACSLCGCPLNPDNMLGDKLSWEVSECPQKKWRRVDNVPHHWELTPESPVEWTMQLLEQPPGPWPANFTGFPSVIQAFQKLLAKYAHTPPPMPDFPHDRGIVICGGGWKFFPSIYVTVRTIRWLGITLPIQIWYLGDKGEFDKRMADALQPFNVGWIDANSFHRENPHTGIRRAIDHGWQLKPYAACYAPYREVICLDADSVPVRPLEDLLNHPEYKRVGACFFPDQAPLQASQWERFGLPPCGLPGLESGQFVVDKGRHWRPLWLTRWMNDFYEYVWHLDAMGLKGHLYGDKDTFAIAWQACGHEMCVPQKKPRWNGGAFLQCNFENKVQFVHYTRNKFKLPGDLDGAPINSDYYTPQSSFGCEGWRKAVPISVPLNAEGHRFLQECDELLRPERYFSFIGGERGWCRDIWDGVTLRNEYRLPACLDGGTIIDLGTNVGAFAHWAMRRKAEHIIAVEPWHENWPHIEKNLAGWGDRISLVKKAVWKDDVSKVKLSSHDAHITGNTSTISMLGNYGDVAEVETISLDSLIGDREIRLVKIDIEGAEGPGMAACTKWRQVQAVVGETHEGVQIDGQVWTYPMIMEILERAGFKTHCEQNGPSTYLFWGDRT